TGSTALLDGQVQATNTLVAIAIRQGTQLGRHRIRHLPLDQRRCGPIEAAEKQHYRQAEEQRVDEREAKSSASGKSRGRHEAHSRRPAPCAAAACQSLYRSSAAGD